MKKFPFIIVILMLNSSLLFSQVAINTTGTNPDPAAMLDVSSTSMGVLVPRLTTVQRTAIPTPPEGLLLYDTDTRSFWYVKNSAWTEISPGSSGWSLTGNAGTDPEVNFIGTLDSTAFKIRVNNRLSGLIDPYWETANTGFGYRVLSGNTTGVFNTAIGYQALFMNDAGLRNTAIGFASMYSNTTGHRNTANGYASLCSNTTGEGNIAIGHSALFYSNGNNNTAIGRYALISNTTGNSNVALGASSLYNNTDRSNLIAIGDSALYNNGLGAVEVWDATANTALGSKALFSNSTGRSNTATGYESLKKNTTGSWNTAIGKEALYFNNSGNNNTAVGNTALQINLDGHNNTALGSRALEWNTSGDNNTVTGYMALNNNAQGSGNTASGYLAGTNLNGGNDNIFLGSSSGPPSGMSIDSSMWLGNTRESEPAIYGDLTDGQIGIGTTAPHSSAKLEVNSTSQGFLPPRMTYAQLLTIPNPADGLLVFCTDCGSNGTAALSIFMAGYWYYLSLNNCTTVPSAPTEGVHVPSASQIIWNWNTVPGAAGYKWNTVNFSATAEDMGSSVTKTETGLTPNTTYTRYVWAYNTCGNSISTPLSATTEEGTWNCNDSFTVTHLSGSVAPVTKTVTYGTVTNIPGEPSKCWITQNLGSDHQATSAYDATEESAGWYWQFNSMQGFKHDGTTRTPNTTWDSYISENSDWLAVNDPCNLLLGSVWRLPTSTEWENVYSAGGWIDLSGPWNSALKLHAAGYLSQNDGSLVERGMTGHFWSKTQHDEISGRALYIWDDHDGMSNSWKTCGFSARCIRE